MTGRVSSCAAMPGAIPHLLMFTRAVPAWAPPVPLCAPRAQRPSRRGGRAWTDNTRGVNPSPRWTAFAGADTRFEVQLGDARDQNSEPKSRVVTLMVRILPKQYSACLRMTASSRKACPSPDDYLEHYCSAASGPKAWGAESAATEYSRACQRTRRMSSTTRRLVIRRRRALCYPWSVAAGG